MSQTVDANILVYASNEDSSEHEIASQLVARLATGPELVVLFWPVIMAYLRIATHPSIFEHPLGHGDAAGNITRLLDRANVRTVGPGERFWAIYRDLARDVPARGNGVPDAQIASLMIEHGVSMIWSRDRDFRKYDQFQLRDPFDS